MQLSRPIVVAIIVALLLLSATLAYSTHVIEQQRVEMRWLAEHLCVNGS